jgi:hypothetical protein
MNVLYRIPEFKSFVQALNEAGVKTKSARRFWGGVTPRGEIVVTAWIDLNDGNGRFHIWRPDTNHGGLKAQWDIGNMRVGTVVKMILLRARKALPVGQKREVAGAAVMPGRWRIVELVDDQDWSAVIEPA